MKIPDYVLREWFEKHPNHTPDQFLRFAKNYHPEHDRTRRKVIRETGGDSIAHYREMLRRQAAELNELERRRLGG